MSAQATDGLCERCQYRRVVQSARGAAFVLCQLAKDDPTYPKYPRLPVNACHGYRPAIVGE